MQVDYVLILVVEYKIYVGLTHHLIYVTRPDGFVGMLTQMAKAFLSNQTVQY